MPFNSNSYYRNKWRREALESLAEARAVKAGPSDDLRDEMFPGWRQRDVSFHAGRARSAWRLYLCQRRICDLDAERKGFLSPL